MASLARACAGRGIGASGSLTAGKMGVAIAACAIAPKLCKIVRRVGKRLAASGSPIASPFRSRLELTEETNRRSCVAGRPHLFDFEQQRVAIAIDIGFDQVLRVTACFAFAPQLGSP